jgi:uncharacterized protein (TIGR02453 family)
MNTVQILQFLEQLQKNNNKTWMDMHKPDYQAARETVLEITDQLIKGLGKVDMGITSLTPKECVFRINRDIRFSKDKSPYKNNMGTYLSKGGKNLVYAGYYLHLQPYNQSFIAGGLYQPPADILKKVRQEIDYNGDKLEAILADKNFKDFFGTIQGESLQRPPKGYDITHPHINWIKLKSFMGVHPITDKTVSQPNFLDYILERFKALVPLTQFLNVVIETEN